MCGHRKTGQVQGKVSINLQFFHTNMNSDRVDGMSWAVWVAAPPVFIASASSVYVLGTQF